MAETVYLLCALTSMFCAVLLYRRYRKGKTRLLMWSTLCFVGLSLNNILLFVDLVILPSSTDLQILRTSVGLAAFVLLVIGLTWEDT